MRKNNYEDIAEVYQDTDNKPDKRFSILPTISMIAGSLKNKTVLDLGCGSGFFTVHFAQSAKHVVGIDNSPRQIALARKKKMKNIQYQTEDIMSGGLPKNDVTNAPFVFGYCQNIRELKKLLTNIFTSLNHKGILIGVIDLPSGDDLQRFGATKILHGRGVGSRIEIILSNGSRKICTLWATYFSKETYNDLLSDVGFSNISWHRTIVSEEGMQRMPEGYWDGYCENPELGYFTAQKNS